MHHAKRRLATLRSSGMACAVVLAHLSSATTAAAANNVIIGLLRADNAFAPGDAWIAELGIELGVSGVTAVTASVGQTVIEFDEVNGDWEQGVAFSTLGELQAALNGVWTLRVDGSSSSTSKFTLNANLLMDGDFFDTATNLSPADMATGVAADGLLSWSDPAAPTTPYVIVVSIDSGTNSQEATTFFGLTPTGHQLAAPRQPRQRHQRVRGLLRRPRRTLPPHSSAPSA